MDDYIKKKAADDRGVGDGSAALRGLQGRREEEGNTPTPMVVGAGDGPGQGAYNFGRLE